MCVAPLNVVLFVGVRSCTIILQFVQALWSLHGRLARVTSLFEGGEGVLAISIKACRLIQRRLRFSGFRV